MKALITTIAVISVTSVTHLGLTAETEQFSATTTDQQKKPATEFQKPGTNRIESPAPMKKLRVFVDIKEEGLREDAHGHMYSQWVIGSIFNALGYLEYDVTLNEDYFRRFLQLNREVDNEFLRRCVSQKTLSPTGPRPDTGSEWAHATVFRLSKYPVQLGQKREGDSQMTLTLVWRDAGTYARPNGPPFHVQVPRCRVLLEHPDRQKRSQEFEPTMKSSYERELPISDISRQVHGFLIGDLFRLPTPPK
jgi:hypothetical protein